MRLTFLSHLLITSGFFVISSSLHADEGSGKTGPWDLKKLFKAPKYEWVNKTDKVRSLLYEGEPFQGKPTQVFAYYASPEPPSKPPTSSMRCPEHPSTNGNGRPFLPR